MKGSDVRELNRLLEVLRFHTVRQVSSPGQVSPMITGRDVKVPAVEVLAARVHRLVRAGFSVSAEADGFPARTPLNGSPGAGKGGRQTMAVDAVDDEGVVVGVDWVPTSSTESAAFAKPMSDPVQLQAVEAMAAMRSVVAALDELDRVLGRFDHLQATSKVPDPPMCWVAQVKYQLQWDMEWEPWRTTDFANRLAQPFDEPRRVSKFVYWFVQNHRRLPDRAEMLAQLERSVVKVRK